MKYFLTTIALLFSFQLSAKICEGFGPQTARDISKKKGTNPVHYSFAPSHEKLNLCNIHFHKNAEHKAKGFSVSGGKGDFGGWKCNGTKDLKPAQLAKINKNYCENVNPGDTIEVHWVHSSCDVKPGKGLGACLSPACANPQLRVETKVFLVVNDDKATDFGKFKANMKKNKYKKYQAANYPNLKDAVQFLGSTTGPSYTEEKCSPLQVTWNVSPSCDTVSMSSLSKWCKSNAFSENKAHGVRQIVKDPRLLSEIK
ncbi:MAG: delta-class carbonic anhydrase [Bdellovibrionales bacterium]